MTGKEIRSLRARKEDSHRYLLTSGAASSAAAAAAAADMLNSPYMTLTIRIMIV